MAAVVKLIPDNPAEKESVLAVLREHPGLHDFIAKVQEKAEEVFPEFSIVLDTVRYDEWDPPVRMLVHITQLWDEYKVLSREFAHWVAYLPEYDWDLNISHADLEWPNRDVSSWRGRDFLIVEAFLHDLDSEASLRTQTGRLYYAAYLEARWWCEQYLEYARTRSSGEHTDVPRLLRSLDPELANNLRFLRQFRNAADYDLELSLETVALQLGDAQLRTELVIAQLDTLAGDGTNS